MFVYKFERTLAKLMRTFPVGFGQSLYFCCLVFFNTNGEVCNFCASSDRKQNIFTDCDDTFLVINIANLKLNLMLNYFGIKL